MKILDWSPIHRRCIYFTFLLPSLPFSLLPIVRCACVEFCQNRDVFFFSSFVRCEQPICVQLFSYYLRLLFAQLTNTFCAVLNIISFFFSVHHHFHACDAFFDVALAHFLSSTRDEWMSKSENDEKYAFITNFRLMVAERRCRRIKLDGDGLSVGHCSCENIWCRNWCCSICLYGLA